VPRGTPRLRHFLCCGIVAAAATTARELRRPRSPKPCASPDTCPAAFLHAHPSLRAPCSGFRYVASNTATTSIPIFDYDLDNNLPGYSDARGGAYNP
jgi:hypothetical protein